MYFLYKSINVTVNQRCEENGLNVFQSTYAFASSLRKLCFREKKELPDISVKVLGIV